MRKFSILVDSSCDLHPDYMKEHDIDVVPMPFTLDDKEYPDGDFREISGADFYKALKNGGVAKTTAINPDTYVGIFTEYAKQGKDLIFLCLSSGLSASSDNSVIAAREVNEAYPNSTIYPIDSSNATGGIGLLTMLTVKKREEGLSAAETVNWLNATIQTILTHFTVDDLHFLHRGGRLSKLSAVAGSLLSVKPLLNISPEGRLQVKDKARGRKAALETLVNQMKRGVEPGAEIGIAAISHCDCEEDAMKLAGMLKEAMNIKHIPVLMMGPIIGAHTGPGAIAMFFESSMTRVEYEEKFYPKK